MLTTMHLLVGGVIGKYVDNIWLIILLALASHYVLDMIPHTPMPTPDGYLKKGLKGVSKKLLLLESIEPVLGILLVSFFIYLAKERIILMITGCFFAFFPDLITFLVWKNQLTWLDKYLPRPTSIFYNKTKTLFAGILTQIVVFIICVLMLIINIKPKA